MRGSKSAGDRIISAPMDSLIPPLDWQERASESHEPARSYISSRSHRPKGGEQSGGGIITSPEIERYIQNLYPLEDPILKEMETLGAKINFPLVGPLVGRVLYQLAKLTSAKTIFEMGSGFGYSAFWFALALPEDGVVHLTDLSEKNSELAKRFFIQGNTAHKARFHVGNALEILKKTNESFDIVFMDLDKELYPKALELAKSKIKAGGLLIADNLLWFGQVLEKEGDPSTEAIKEFNQKLFNDCNFISTLLPIRDGVGVAYKIR